MEDTENVGGEDTGTDLFDSLVDQAINTVQGRFDADEPDTEVVEAKEEEAPEAKVEDVPNPLQKQLDEVLARSKDLESKLAEVTNAPKGDTVESLKKLAETDVPGLVSKLGLDPEHIMDVLIAEKLGDKAPPQLKEKLRDYKLRKEIEAVNSKYENEKKLNQAREYYSRVNNEAREYVSKGLDEKKTPVMSLVTKDNLDFVHQLVLQEIDKDAQNKIRRGEHNGNLLSYEEAASNVEKIFSIVEKAVAKKLVTEKAGKKVTGPVTRAKTTETTAKPKDETSELEERGLQAALATYKQLEAARNKGR